MWLSPSCHYGFSEIRPSVGSKAWTQSPPSWIRSTGGASNFGIMLTLSFLAQILLLWSHLPQWTIGQVTHSWYGWQDWQLVAVYSQDDYALDTSYFHSTIIYCLQDGKETLQLFHPWLTARNHGNICHLMNKNYFVSTELGDNLAYNCRDPSLRGHC